MMLPINIRNSGPTPGYPGGYVPNPLISESIVDDQCVKNDSEQEPHFDIYQNSKYYKVELVVPGFKRENFLVSVSENCLLSVTAMHTEDEKNEMVYPGTVAMNNMCLNRQVALPENIDTDFTIAEYKSGILSILFLKNEKAYKHRASMVIVY